ILANGANVETSNNHGAGAGGSVWLNVGALVSTGGTGEIRASGGNARNGYAGGGGGGGRIAIYYELLEFDQSKIVSSGGLRGNNSSTHGSPGTVYLEDKTGTNVHPLHIVGNGSDASYAATTLDVIGNNGLAIETASVEYTGAELIDADIELINGNFTATGNVIFNQSLTDQSGSVTDSGEATFTQYALIGNRGASFLIIGGRLLVPNNALVVDGITLSLAQDHTFASIHIKNGGVLTTPVATETFKNGIAIEATTIIVDEGSRIDVSAKGHVGESGTGIYTGGSYGGRGGNYGRELSGPGPGDYETSDDAGYGGRNSDINGRGSVRAGGENKLTAEELPLDGSILANGANVQIYKNHHGAGAGGDVCLNVGALVSTGGTGEI